MTAKVEVLVAVIGRAHGIGGEVTLHVRTDEPASRLAVGAVLHVEGAPHRTVEVRSTRWHSGRLLARFVELTDRTAAEQATGTRLAISVPAAERPADEEEFYDHQLLGLAVRDVDDHLLGEITGVRHGGAQDLLVVQTSAGERLVPFVADLVPSVDLASGQVIVTPVPGLLDDPDDGG